MQDFPEPSWMERYRERVNADPEMEVIGGWFSTSLRLTFAGARIHGFTLELPMSMLRAFIGAAAIALCAAGQAQTYPFKVVKIVVAYAPGGATDVVTRAVAQRLSPMWNQPVIIENKPGANTNIAAGDVAKAPADGYTLLSTAESTFAVNPYVYATLPFDPLKDYVPVT